MIHFWGKMKKIRSTQVNSDRSLVNLVLALIVIVPLVYYPWTSEVTRVKTLVGMILIYLFAVFFFIRAYKDKTWLISQNEILVPAFLYLMICIGSRCWSAYPWTWTEEILRISSPLVFYILFPTIQPGTEIKIRSTRFLAVISTILSLYGLAQAMRMDWISWGKPVRDGVISSMGHPNILAPFLIIGIAANLILLITCQQYQKKVINIFALLVIVICFGLTKSKGAFLGCGAGLFFYGIIWGSKKTRIIVLAGLAAIVLCCFLAFHVNPRPFEQFYTTNIFRIWTWQGSAQTIMEQPGVIKFMFGSGLGTFPILFPQYRNPSYLQQFKYAENLMHAHCEYLEIAVETGFIGLLLFLWIMTSFYFRLYHHARKKPLDVFSRVYAMAVLAILIHNLVCVNMRWFTSWLFLLLIMGLALPETTVSPKPMPHFKLPHLISILMVLSTLALCMSILLADDMRSEHYYFKGKNYLSWNDPLEAQKQLGTAVQIWQYNLPAWYDLAYAYSIANNPTMAIETYRKIIRLHPAYQRVHRNLAICCHQFATQTNNSQYMLLALDEMKKEIMVNDTDENRFYLAQLLESHGETAKSSEQYETFLNLMLTLKESVLRKKAERSIDDLPLVLPDNLGDSDSKIQVALQKIKIFDSSHFDELDSQFSKNYPLTYKNLKLAD
jgi:O-antigen ligase